MCFSMLSVSKHIVTYYKNTHINSYENMIKYIKYIVVTTMVKGQGKKSEPTDTMCLSLF